MYQTPREPDIELIARYENALNEGQSAFFDSMEFEQIIEHYMEGMDYPKAVSAGQQALDIYPFSNELRILYAESLLFEGDSQSVLREIEYLETVMPDNPELTVLKGLYCSINEKPKQAVEHYLKAYDTCENKLRVDIFLGNDYASLSNFPLAIKHLSRALLSEPREPAALQGLVSVLVESRHYPEGEYIFRKITEKDPYNAPVWHHLGVFLTYGEKWEQAIEAYNYALLIDPKYVPAYYDISEVYMSLEQWDKAVQLLKELVTFSSSEDPYPYIKIGECYECLDDFESACEFYFKAANYDPGLSRAWYRLGSIHFSQGYNEQALRYALQALHIEADSIDNLRLVWEVYEALDNFEKARLYIDRVIEHPQANVEDYLDMAYFLYQRDELDDAMQVLINTRMLFPAEKETLYHFAALHILLGEQAKGLTLLKRAVQGAPEISQVISDNYPELYAREDVLAIISSAEQTNNEKQYKS